QRTRAVSHQLCSGMTASLSANRPRTPRAPLSTACIITRDRYLAFHRGFRRPLKGTQERLVNYPILSEATRIERLAHPGKRVNFVLDTDTFNEIDDQFAVVYSLLSQKSLDLKAIY